ncbi:MAG: carbonic anhydrase [Thermoplasmata archaeon]|nr:MAG: carbonic anhydrase [Thermoplasmata archaeon]
MTQFTGYMALQELLSGNERFVSGEMRHPDMDNWKRETLAKGQTPSAIIIGCSDSRVDPAVIFDQGLGFLFVNRSPGHIVDDVTLGTVEYAVEQLGTQLVMVLGHTHCGAVTLAMDSTQVGGYLGRIQKLVHDVIAWADGGEVDTIDVTTVEEGVEMNVRGAVGQIKASEPVIAPLVTASKVMVVGAIYDIDTGEVRLLE